MNLWYGMLYMYIMVSYECIIWYAMYVWCGMICGMVWYVYMVCYAMLCYVCVSWYATCVCGLVCCVNGMYVWFGMVCVWYVCVVWYAMLCMCDQALLITVCTRVFAQHYWVRGSQDKMGNK